MRLGHAATRAGHHPCCMSLRQVCRLWHHEAYPACMLSGHRSLRSTGHQIAPARHLDVGHRLEVWRRVCNKNWLPHRFLSQHGSKLHLLRTTVRLHCGRTLGATCRACGCAGGRAKGEVSLGRRLIRAGASWRVAERRPGERRVGAGSPWRIVRLPKKPAWILRQRDVELQLLHHLCQQGAQLIQVSDHPDGTRCALGLDPSTRPHENLLRICEHHHGHWRPLDRRLRDQLQTWLGLAPAREQDEVRALRSRVPRLELGSLPATNQCATELLSDVVDCLPHGLIVVLVGQLVAPHEAPRTRLPAQGCS
mmetsp:Transcript_32302/g.106621  ORF Transcript_32302/g.106621 Transcript_32302/m.106621 type:complete len:308 (+) Transcript_32302:363-1286(+)